MVIGHADEVIELLVRCVEVLLNECIQIRQQDCSRQLHEFAFLEPLSRIIQASLKISSTPPDSFSNYSSIVSFWKPFTA